MDKIWTNTEEDKIFAIGNDKLYKYNSTDYETASCVRDLEKKYYTQRYTDNTVFLHKNN